jgi:hypothetical protein
LRTSVRLLFTGADFLAFDTGFVIFFLTEAIFLFEDDVFAFGAVLFLFVFFFVVTILASVNVSGLKLKVSGDLRLTREEALEKRTLLPENEINSNVHACLLSNLTIDH